MDKPIHRGMPGRNRNAHRHAPDRPAQGLVRLTDDAERVNRPHRLENMGRSSA